MTTLHGIRPDPGNAEHLTCVGLRASDGTWKEPQVSITANCGGAGKGRGKDDGLGCHLTLEPLAPAHSEPGGRCAWVLQMVNARAATGKTLMSNGRTN